MTDVVVVGQVGRDLVLRIPDLPDDGGSVTASDRVEVLGGKGANQAVAFAQLGVPVALVGVVGEDSAATLALDRAVADGIDIGPVVRRAGADTALLLDLVTDGGRRRLVESVPSGVLLTEDDVVAAARWIASCRALVLQLQQPGLGRADVLRADAAEAAELVGRELPGEAAVRRAAAELLRAGPRLVSLAAGDAGDLTAWREGPELLRGTPVAGSRWADGDVLVPLLGEEPVDPTGAGDATVAAMTAALLDGAGPEDAAWTAAAAAALTVARLGGRPALSASGLAQVLRLARRT